MAWSLEQYVTEHGGVAYGAETGFLLARAPDLLRAPDAAYLREPPPATAGEAMGYLRGAPDLAVEIRSPSNRPGEIHAKVADLLAAGSKLVWVVDPDRRLATVYRTLLAPTLVAADGILDGEDVVPGFQVTLSELLDF